MHPVASPALSPLRVSDQGAPQPFPSGEGIDDVSDVGVTVTRTQGTSWGPPEPAELG